MGTIFVEKHQCRDIYKMATSATIMSSVTSADVASVVSGAAASVLHGVKSTVLSVPTALRSQRESNAQCIPSPCPEPQADQRLVGVRVAQAAASVASVGASLKAQLSEASAGLSTSGTHLASVVRTRVNAAKGGAGNGAE